MSANQTETIGQRLRRLRLEKSLSQRELSAPGVSYAYISRIEAGTRQPSVKALRKLAPKLGVSTEYLETGSEIGADKARELRLADAELALRLGDDAKDAEEGLRVLLDEAIDAADFTAATRARVALGLIAAHLGRHDDAVRRLEEALNSPAAPTPAGRPEAFVTLGRAYAVVGTPERAVELFERCLEELSQNNAEDEAAVVRFRIYLSYALADMGNLSRAYEVVSEALEHATELSDPYTLVRLYWSIARLSALQGQPSVALDHARRAIALLEATEDTLQLGRAHLLSAGIMNMEGDAEKAEEHLETAAKLLTGRPDTNDLASLRTEQANAAVKLGRLDEAIERAEEAHGLLGDEDPAERGAALAVLAEAHAKKGDVDTALPEFDEAVALLSENGRWRHAEITCRTWAEVLDSNKRGPEAERVRQRAERYAGRASQHAASSAATR
jgi:tetratricopeptide (TPR) repeat protein